MTFSLTEIPRGWHSLTQWLTRVRPDGTVIEIVNAKEKYATLVVRLLSYKPSPYRNDIEPKSGLSDAPAPVNQVSSSVEADVRESWLEDDIEVVSRCLCQSCGALAEHRETMDGWEEVACFEHVDLRGRGDRFFEHHESDDDDEAASAMGRTGEESQECFAKVLGPVDFRRLEKVRYRESVWGGRSQLEVYDLWEIERVLRSVVSRSQLEEAWLRMAKTIDKLTPDPHTLPSEIAQIARVFLRHPDADASMWKIVQSRIDQVEAAPQRASATLLVLSSIVPRIVSREDVSEQIRSYTWPMLNDVLERQACSADFFEVAMSFLSSTPFGIPLAPVLQRLQKGVFLTPKTFALLDSQDCLPPAIHVLSCLRQGLQLDVTDAFVRSTCMQAAQLLPEELFLRLADAGLDNTAGQNVLDWLPFVGHMVKRTEFATALAKPEGKRLAARVLALDHKELRLYVTKLIGFEFSRNRALTSTETANSAAQKKSRSR